MRSRLERGAFVLAVVGEFSSGKSFLLNALLGKFDLLATNINPSTATITQLEYGSPEEAYAYREGGRSEQVPLDFLTRHVAGNDEVPQRVVVKVDSEFLRRGFLVVDTPGLASVNPAHRRATLRFLPSADAVLYLIDTQQPFTQGDASFLNIVRSHVETIFIVQTKIDLWRQDTDGGVPPWEAAHARIAELAAVNAPGTYVYALSAREYIEGVNRHDQTLIDRSRLPLFKGKLDASLVKNTGRARLRRAGEQSQLVVDDALRRIDAGLAMLLLGRGELLQRLEETAPRWSELDAFGERTRSQVEAAARLRSAALQQRGEALIDETQRALAQAFDAADISRLRDRAWLHTIVDRTVATSVGAFADQIAADVCSQYAGVTAAARERLPLRFELAESAAQAFDAESGSAMWREDTAAAISAAIVLEALSGPATSIVASIAARFGATRAGTYMKRELTADLRSEIFPKFGADVSGFVDQIDRRLHGLSQSFTASLNEALQRARSRLIGSIESALAAQERPEGVTETHEALQRRKEMLQRIFAELAEIVANFLAREEETAAPDAGPETVRRSHLDLAFDREAYARGLRPERWRVAVLGGLRRGKSS